MKIQKARKEHRCTLCGRRIPAGVRYWYKDETDEPEAMDTDHREHTNCEDFAKEPHLPPEFNRNRKATWI